MLHPPYTMMVLSFAIAGAALARTLSWPILGLTLVAYFCGLGIGAHFLDQLPGMGSRYVRHWPTWALWGLGLGGVTIGMAIGVAGVLVFQAPVLLGLVLVQGVCALGYPLAPLFGGVLHRDTVFAISWGSLPCVTSYYVQSGSISVGAILLAAVFATVAAVEIRVSRTSRQLRGQAQIDALGGTFGRPSRASRIRRPDLILQVLSTGTILAALSLLAVRVLLGA